MGKILTTTYKDTVEKVIGLRNDLVNNPFYQYNDQKPIICTYYNLDKTFSSLDTGSKLSYNNIGADSPLRFNRIYDFIIYGFNKIQLSSKIDEFGLESDDITGDCVVIPNNFMPTEGDYFEVDHIKDSTYLFLVTDVQKDTLNDGSNAFKVSYKLEYNSNINLEPLILHNYRAIEVREGTNIKKVVRCEDYDIAKFIDDTCVYLKKYFNDLFYNQYVQTWIYEDLTSYRIYDQYMIEFLIRNKILADGEDSYIAVTHIIPVHQTFNIDYDKTFLREFEKKRKDKLLSSNRNILPDYINHYGSIFDSRYETYYKAQYVERQQPPYTTYCIGDDLLYDIVDHKLVDDTYEENNIELWKNILVKYFWDEEITKEEVESIENLKFEYAKNAYYIIPLLIFCLEKYIISFLNK